MGAADDLLDERVEPRVPSRRQSVAGPVDMPDHRIGAPRGAPARCANNQAAPMVTPGSPGVGGTHVMYVLHHADRPELYNGLPADPGISPLVSLWKGMAKPLASLALGAVALGSLFHYVMKGPNEVSKETENEVEKEGS